MTLPRWEWFLATSLQLLYIMLAIYSCGAYGCILVFSCHDYRVIGWCVLYTPSHGADPSTQISDRGHPSSARWGSPSTYCAHSMFTSYDTYELVENIQLYYVITCTTLFTMFLVTLMFYMICYDSQSTVSFLFRLPCHCWVSVHCVLHTCTTMPSMLLSPLYYLWFLYYLWYPVHYTLYDFYTSYNTQSTIPYMITIPHTTLSPPYYIYNHHTTYNHSVHQTICDYQRHPVHCTIYDTQLTLPLLSSQYFHAVLTYLYTRLNITLCHT